MSMMHVLQEVSVVCVLLCLMVTCSQQTREARKHRDSSPNRRHRRTVDTGNPLQHLVNALQSDSMTNTELYMHYTPSTPAPHNINCYVEVPTTIRKGGRCIQLGGSRGRGSRNRPWACQAGIHLALSSDCQNLRGRSGRGGRG